MNTFVGKLYFFTKLTTSFILLIFVIFLSYLLLKAYRDGDSDKFDLISLVEPLKIEIEKNAKNNQRDSYTINSKLNLLETKTEGIEKILNTKSHNSNDIASLNKNIMQLQDRIYDLEKNILEKEKISIDNLSSNSKEINTLKEIIIIKFKNNLDFKEELVLLESLSTKSKKPIFEKITLIQAINFIGVEKLKKNFYELRNNFMKEFVKNENDLIPDFLFDFVKITPSSNLEISNKNIFYIKKANKHIEDENFYEAVNCIKQIEVYEVYFSDWLEQAAIYESFIKNIHRI